MDAEGDGRHQKLEVKVGEDGTCATFSLWNEDHTLGNSLRHVIAQDPTVTFCAYNVPHPSESLMNVRVQTRDPSVPATAAFERGLEALRSLTEDVRAKFHVKVVEFKKDHGIVLAEDDLDRDDDEESDVRVLSESE